MASSTSSPSHAVPATSTPPLSPPPTSPIPPPPSSSSTEPLAIIGLGCRFPGHSNSPPLFWHHLLHNVDCVSPVPPGRWSPSYYTGPPSVPGKIAATRCGFVDHLLSFDHDAFSISRREAEGMDPQQKMLLEVALQALEDARLAYAGSATGVFVGIGQAEQLGLSVADAESINAYSVTGSALSIAANRVSYALDLRGPSLSVDTACSSSMTAMHYAKESLRRGECEHALVAGVNVLLDPAVMIQFSKLGVLSPDGRCKSFLDSADGYVRSEGCGVAVLTRLSTALAAHSHIYAVLRGTAINSDGHRSPSLTMPSQQAQMDVFHAALADAHTLPSQVWYAEAHATGTKVGDPIEANAIGQTLGRGRGNAQGKGKANGVQQHGDEVRTENGVGYHHTEKDREYAHTHGFFLTDQHTSTPCPTSPSPSSSPAYSPSSEACTSSSPLLLGAVKTHVGHLETASFMAGLLKVCLMLQHETLLPNQWQEGDNRELNPAIGWDEWGMEVVTEVRRFERRGKVAMISSFGFGGSNGAAIIEAWDPPQLQEEEGVGKGKENGHAKVNGGMNGHHAHTNGHTSPIPSSPLPSPPSPPSPLAPSSPPYLFLLSAQTPAALDARIAEFQAVVASPSPPPADAIAYTLATRVHHRHLSFAVASSLSPPPLFCPARKVSPTPLPLVWCFAGQGPQHPAMGRLLYSTYPTFRATIDALDSLYHAVAGHSLTRDVGLFTGEGPAGAAVYELRYTLPALVFLQVGLVDLWRSMGVRPVAVFGHSFGEMAAAYAAGACGKRQVVETAYHRARLLCRIDGCGQMMAVGCSPERILPFLHQHPDAAYIAAYNGPNSITLGGTHAAIAALAATCATLGLFHRVLKITAAYHTPLMRPCKEEALATFSSTLAGVGQAEVPYYSTVTSGWKEDGFDAAYTWQGIEGAVHFSDAVAACLERFGPDTAFMEMTAHPVLSAYLTECGARHTLHTLHRQQNEVESVLRVWAGLVVLGLPPPFASLLPLPPHPCPSLPSFLPYPFQRQPCHREDPDHRIRREVPSHLPLAGREIPTIQPTFELKLSTATHAWTADHVVQGATVFPAAGYLEMALEVLGMGGGGGGGVGGGGEGGGVGVEGVVIGRGMILGDVCRVVRSVREGDVVRVYSKKELWDHNPWTLHFTAHRPTAQPHPSPHPPPLPAWVDGLPSRCGVHYSARQVYERFRSVGLSYGPLFQGLTRMSVGDLEAWGVMDVTRVKAQASAVYRVHPALLDATFHVLLGTIRYLHLPYVPTAIRRVDWWAKPEQLPDVLHVYARAVALEGDRLEGDLVICDEAGALLGRVEGMQCTALGMNDKAVQPLLTARWQPWEVPDVFFPQRTDSWAAIPSDVLSYEAALDAACVSYVSDLLHANTTSLTPLRPSDWPVHRQRYWQWCQRLLASHPVLPDAAASLCKAASQADYPFAKEALAIARVGPNLCALLSDPYAVQRLLFSDGLMGDIYAQSLTFQPYVRLMSEMVLAYIQQHPHRTIHILEMGAGTGALTHDLLTLLSSSPPPSPLTRLKYYYTDVSHKFLHDARTRFAAYPFIEYQLFNVDSTPSSSSFPSSHSSSSSIPPHSLDLILAFDVLHVSASLSTSLSTLQHLLAPCGLLMCIELTRPWVWVEMFFGLFQGWWGMTDSRPRCWLSADEWEETLQGAGFTHVQVVNDRKERGGREFCHSLITCHSPSLTSLAASPPLTPTRPMHVFDAADPGHDVDYLLSQAQQLIALSEPHDFFLLTDDGQNIPPPPSSSSFPSPPTPPHHALHIGFTRVLSNEAPHHRIFMLDLPPHLSDPQRAAHLHLVQSMRDRTLEREFAVRGGVLYVPRFVPYQVEEARPVGVEGGGQGGGAWRLEVGTVGQLSSLRYHQTSPSPTLSLTPPSPTDVVVAVHASGLNFKDLMLALGMLTNPMGLDRAHLAFDPPTALGIEFSGVVLAVGGEVDGVQVGDEVMGVGKHCLANVVVTHHHFVARKPAHLSHVQAASMPIVFATAYAGLVEKARVGRGETVLVHSAAGGIGQAAIQLCQDAGAAVIATVGSAAKRAFLASTYGVTRFADSHSTAAWHADVLSMTEGGGVDVVLNSLKGDAIPSGLSLLTAGGRFVEIGKVDILANRSLPMSLLLRDISFLSVQLDVLMAASTRALQRQLTAVSRMAEESRIRPIVDRVFPCGEVEAAFRYLMAGQHLGKVVIDFSLACQATLIHPPSPTHTPSPPPSPTACIYPPSHPFSPHQTYVLTGGTGAVGLRLVHFIAQRGGRHFLLLSRRGPASLRPSERSELSSLSRFGVRVLTPATDITDPSSLADAWLEAVQAGWPRRVALLHLAMVLDDDPIPRLTEERLARVIRCKVDGAIHLVDLFPRADVSFAVFFSSAASVLGNPSQANYAAANAFLDAYATRLRSCGYHAKVLNLGVVGDVGVLAEDYKLRQLLMAKGFAGGLTSSGVCAAVELMARGEEEDRWTDPARMRGDQHLLGAFDWDAVVSAYPILASRFAHLVDHTAQHSDASSASSADAPTLDTVRGLVAALLGLAADKLDVGEALTRQGLDSLLAVELSAVLKKKVAGCNVSQMELLGGMSVEQIWEVAQAAGAGGGGGGGGGGEGAKQVD